MESKELYNHIHNELFKGGSCTPNSWYLVNIVNAEGKRATFEAMLPNRGNLKIRRPKGIKGEERGKDTVYYYDVWKFTNKKELKYDDVYYSTRPDKYENIDINTKEYVS